jgi:hypothetical protein
MYIFLIHILQKKKINLKKVFHFNFLLIKFMNGKQEPNLAAYTYLKKKSINVPELKSEEPGCWLLTQFYIDVINFNQT